MVSRSVRVTNMLANITQRRDWRSSTSATQRASGDLFSRYQRVRQREWSNWLTEGRSQISMSPTGSGRAMRKERSYEITGSRDPKTERSCQIGDHPDSSHSLCLAIQGDHCKRSGSRTATTDIDYIILECGVATNTFRLMKGSSQWIREGDVGYLSRMIGSTTR